MMIKSDPSSPIVRFGVRLFSVMVLIVAPIMFYKAYEDLRQARASRSWPTTQGAISTSAVREKFAGTKITYEADIEYRYDADGRGRIGRELRFGDMGSGKKAAAEALVASYPIGKPVTVYYDPRSPDTATLEPGVSNRNYILFIFPAAALVMGILGWRASRRPPAPAAGPGVAP